MKIPVIWSASVMTDAVPTPEAKTTQGSSTNGGKNIPQSSTPRESRLVPVPHRKQVAFPTQHPINRCCTIRTSKQNGFSVTLFSGNLKHL